MQPWSDVVKGIFLNHEQLLMGWLLGMLSPAVIESIRRGRRLKLLERAITLDLHELQYMMALKAFVIRERAAKLDDDFLVWMEQILVIYKGKKPARPFIEMMQRLRQIPVRERAKHDPKRGLTLTDGNAPMLNIHTNEISLFPVASQITLHSQCALQQQAAGLSGLMVRESRPLTCGSLLAVDRWQRVGNVAAIVEQQTTTPIVSVRNRIATFNGAMNAEQLASLLGVSEITIYKHAKAGKIASFSGPRKLLLNLRQVSVFDGVSGRLSMVMSASA